MMHVYKDAGRGGLTPRASPAAPASLTKSAFYFVTK